MIVKELLARLGFEVDTRNVADWEKRVGKAKLTMKGAANAAKELGGFVAKVTKAFTIGAGAAVFFVGRTAAEFEKLRASLKTVTGSTEAAEAAFAGIKDLAKQTPFQVQELTKAFIKLKALGLNPSREALISYGNTASAMGKSLNDFIEAVADAATGEFERLKEFGIKASSQGDQVAFTFQGVTTTVGKNAKEIEAFLQGIGNNQFAGAMAQQMDTLSGVISNIQDNIAAFAVEVGEKGLLPALKDVGKEIRDMTGGGGDLAKTIAQVLSQSVRTAWRLFKEGIPVLLSIVEGFAKLMDLLGGPGGMIAALAGGKAVLMAFSLGLQSMSTSSVAAAGAMGTLGIAAGALGIALAGAGLIIAHTEQKIAKLRAEARAAQDELNQNVRESISKHDGTQLDAQLEKDEGMRATAGGHIYELENSTVGLAVARLGKTKAIALHGWRKVNRYEANIARARREEATAEANIRAANEEIASRQTALSDTSSAVDRAAASATVGADTDRLLASLEPHTDVGRFKRMIRGSPGMSEEAINTATEAFVKARKKGATIDEAYRKGRRALKGLGIPGYRGSGKHKKKKDELTADELLERDFGGGLGSPVGPGKVRPTLGSTINKIDASYAPKIDVQVTAVQQPGEDTESFARRVGDIARNVLNDEARKSVDHFMGAVSPA